MPQLKVGERSLEIDEKGFLQETDAWDEAVALALGASEGITALTPEHLKVARYLRDHWLAHGVAPMVRKLCKETGCKLSRIYELFPSGPAMGACKVAGLPNAKGCV
ncbi:MAG: TusE/DsrC/DsvC family sulfur relay protein [Deltaproteobacteria bacterium]|nr:TusE/DsrC/DsvC family sulfur relay protein [Deltaproteobacteria bacterium]